MRKRAPTTLSPEDRAFLGRVSEAAFTNPFGPRREALDAEVAGTTKDDPDVVERMVARIEARLGRLARGGELDAARFDPADASLVEDAVLFVAFHRHRPEFERLVSSLEGPTDGVRSDVGVRVLRDLAASGVAPERARRALEIFFQLHRAHSSIASGLVGAGPSMRALRASLFASLFTHDVRRYETRLWNRMEDFSTLLLGETGTGKGAAASAIGFSGFIAYDEARRRFVHAPSEGYSSLSLGELPESLLESSLFGHRKGAFTGAIEDHDGVFARSRPHGTVFLDEIGDVPVHVQSKLLRVLQERTFVPIGSTKSRRFEGRVVAATSRPLEALLASGGFRVDLYYRIASNVIVMPTLRDRIAESPPELELLVAHLCHRITGEADPALARETHAVIVEQLGERHPFPGNVRELEQCVRRVLLTGTAGRAAAPTSEADAFLDAIASGSITAEELVDGYCQRLFAKSGSFVDVARITGLDRRTVKARIGRGRR